MLLPLFPQKSQLSQLQQICMVSLITGLSRYELCINMCSTLVHFVLFNLGFGNSEADFVVSDGVQRINGEQLSFAKKHLTASHQAEKSGNVQLGVDMIGSENHTCTTC